MLTYGVKMCVKNQITGNQIMQETLLLKFRLYLVMDIGKAKGPPIIANLPNNMIIFHHVQISIETQRIYKATFSTTLSFYMV